MGWKTASIPDRERMTPVRLDLGTVRAVLIDRWIKFLRGLHHKFTISTMINHPQGGGNLKSQWSQWSPIVAYVQRLLIFERVTVTLVPVSAVSCGLVSIATWRDIL
jgi:hypothetical protein